MTQLTDQELRDLKALLTQSLQVQQRLEDAMAAQRALYAAGLAAAHKEVEVAHAAYCEAVEEARAAHLKAAVEEARAAECVRRLADFIRTNKRRRQARKSRQNHSH